jgi:hypothetical protein
VREAWDKCIVAAETAVVVLLRETLERELEDAAASLLFDALGDFGPQLPQSVSDVVALLHGPLRMRLSSRYGAARADKLVEDIERALRAAEKTSELSGVRRGFEETQQTSRFPALGSRLDVIVVSGSRLLVERLGALFAKTAANFIPVHTAGDLARLQCANAVVLVDATEVPRASPRALAASLRAASVVLLFGGDVEGAPELVEAFGRVSVPLMAFRSDEPIDALLDVLRSRLPQ